MKPKEAKIDYDNIYSCLKDRSQYNLNGLTTLKQVKKICNCNTADIIESAKLNEIKKVYDVISHTTIFDFGITSENLLKSSKQDNINIAIPKYNNLRGITNEM